MFAGVSDDNFNARSSPAVNQPKGLYPIESHAMDTVNFFVTRYIPHYLRGINIVSCMLTYSKY